MRRSSSGPANRRRKPLPEGPSFREKAVGDEAASSDAVRAIALGTRTSWPLVVVTRALAKYAGSWLDRGVVEVSEDEVMAWGSSTESRSLPRVGPTIDEVLARPSDSDLTALKEAEIEDGFVLSTRHFESESFI